MQERLNPILVEIQVLQLKRECSWPHAEKNSSACQSWSPKKKKKVYKRRENAPLTEHGSLSETKSNRAKRDRETEERLEEKKKKTKK